MDFRIFYNLRAALVAGWAFSLITIILFIGPDTILNSYDNITPDGVRSFIVSFGVFSVLVYIIIHIFRPFVFLPVTPFSIAGGFLFGTVYGLSYTIIGLTISAIITFTISRYLFRDYVKQKIKGRFLAWDNSLEKKGIFYIIILRMIPVLPFDAVGYLSGASSIKFRDYIIGTMIGDLPGTFALTLLGSSLLDIGSTTFYISIGMVLILIILPEAYKRFFSKRPEERLQKIN